MLRVNGSKISELKISEDIPVPGGKPGTVVTSGTSLETLAQYGIKDPLLAPQTLVLFMEELGKQEQCVIFERLIWGTVSLFGLVILDTPYFSQSMTSRHFTASPSTVTRNSSL